MADMARSNGARMLSPAEGDAYLAPGCDGILGWDFLKSVAKRSVSFDLKQNRLEFDTLPRYGGSGADLAMAAPIKVEQVGGGQLPCVDMDVFGTTSCLGARGILDTGSLITIVSTVLSDTAGLFPAEDGAYHVASGYDGKSVKLLAMDTAGIRIGSIQRYRARVWSGVPAMMQAIGIHTTPVALLGLDFLGSHFTIDFEESMLLVMA